MKKSLSVILIAIVLLVSFSRSTFACDEKLTDTYVPQILFGDSAQSKASDEKVKMLMSALYLCSEQSDGLGQEKISYLRDKKVSGVPVLTGIDIKKDQLAECSHNTWEYEYPQGKKNQANRKKLLQSTVNKVFDFGFFNNLFGKGKGKCNSFAAMLYYSHILTDYLADDRSDTRVFINGNLIPAFYDEPYIEINGNVPNFDINMSYDIDSPHNYSGVDNSNRTGKAFGIITPNKLQSSSTRANMSGITPSGWSFNKYPGIVKTDPAYLYNRCHLIAHSLGGEDKEKNLVTGTRYMNDCMGIFENKVLEYVRNTRKPVLYRATPYFKGDNKLCSGVQLEAYSLEEPGALQFNVFCYNVQPKVIINYSSGENTEYFAPRLKFAVSNVSDNNPDLIYEMDKHLKILFDDQKESGNYISMTNEINSIANKARRIESKVKNSSDEVNEEELKVYEAKYFNVLKRYIPKLLENEEFFKSAFE